MLTRERKEEQAQELRQTLEGISTLFILENRGLTVNAVNQLRSRIREIDARYKVYKNSVVRRAVEGTPLEGLSEHLLGPNAFAFTYGDGVALAKVLRDFTKENPVLTFKQAYLEGQILGSEQAVQVAELPTREELLTKLAYLLQSPMRRLVVALNGPIQQLASALSQVAEKKES
ncbi:MAG TPA: 50S ribosomal protein L10 [Acidobacteria bacterium]|nr:50S ribosomal protein L10 [Acidobacteriota bacterium]